MKQFFRRFRAAAAVLLLLLSAATAAGCGRRESASAADKYRERYNILVENLGYDTYVASEKAFTVRRDGFSALLVGGLIRAEATVQADTIPELELSFTDQMQAYLESLDDREEAVVNGLYLEALGALALSREWETLDQEDVRAFVADTLVSALSEVQRMDDYKIHASYTMTQGCTVRLTRLK